jgi:hypothetical protein
MVETVRFHCRPRVDTKIRWPHPGVGGDDYGPRRIGLEPKSPVEPGVHWSADSTPRASSDISSASDFSEPRCSQYRALSWGMVKDGQGVVLANDFTNMPGFSSPVAFPSRPRSERITLRSARINHRLAQVEPPSPLIAHRPSPVRESKCPARPSIRGGRPSIRGDGASNTLCSPPLGGSSKEKQG